jgi:hypothetical protein
MSPLPRSATVPTRIDPASIPVVRLAGDYGPLEAADLRQHLLAELERIDGDVFVDARGATGFSDAAMSALSAARVWAERNGYRMSVLDGEDGVVASRLRRTGRHFRLSVYPDARSACQGLSAARKSRAGRVLSPAQPRGSVPAPALTALANPGRSQVE